VGLPQVAVCLLLFGAYYAATDGVLMALASAVVAPQLRTTGLGLLTGATSVARLLASVLFGAAWTRWGMEAAVAAFASALVLAVAFTAVTFARRGPLLVERPPVYPPLRDVGHE
jgi:hypothetical protein